MMQDIRQIHEGLKPICVFGYCSLFLLSIPMFTAVVFFLNPQSGDGFQNLGRLVVAFVRSCEYALPSFLCSLVSFFRREEPRWPGFIGFISSLVPSCLDLFFLFYFNF